MNKDQTTNEIISGIISLNKYIETQSDKLGAQNDLDKEDRDLDVMKDAVLSIFVSAKIRALAIEATFSQLSDQEEQLREQGSIKAANKHAKHLLASMQQAYQIMSSMYILNDEQELGVEFTDDVMVPMLDSLTQLHFPNIVGKKEGEG